MCWRRWRSCPVSIARNGWTRWPRSIRRGDDDPLVLDKWFAIQALSPLPDTVQAVETLKSHPDFDLRNPNRIRALISSFAGNQVRFHDPPAPATGCMPTR